MNNPIGLQLVWNGKDKIINHHNEVPFRILNEISKKSLKGDDKNSIGNIIIRGDNLEGLKALKPYYLNSIKVIYIDPPYNTGMKQGSTGWVYSDRVDNPIMKKWFNKVVGGEHEDYCRHTKWLCMMMPRLKLLRELLSEDGVICISIDDTELGRLLSLMDEIFGEENKEEVISWRRRHNQPNDKSKAISKVAEFIVVYAKNLEYLKKKKSFHGLPLTGDFANPDNDPRGEWASKPWKAGSGQTGSRYKIVTPTGKVLDEEWLGSRETYKAYLAESRIYFPKKGAGFPRKKYYKFEREEEGQCAHNFWGYEDFGSNQEATDELKKLNIKFDNPKPVRLIKALLTIFSDQDSIILDSFAGSGTTGHAVLELNKDGGNRKFILIQLDEGQEGEKVDVCDTATAARIRKVIQGYSYKDAKNKTMGTKGLGGGFKYYEINGTLKDEKGFINSLLSKEDLAKFILYIETKESQLKLSKFNGDFKIGEKHNVIFYFIHDKKVMLDNDFLDKIDYEKVKRDNRFIVVYGYGNLLDDDYMEENRENLRFMQIPNDLDKIARI